MFARRTVDDYVGRSRYQGSPVSKKAKKTKQRTTQPTNNGILDGVRRGGLASLAAYVFKLSACAPIYDTAVDVTEPLSPAFSFGGGYAFGYGATSSERAGGVLMYLASLAPEISYAAGTGQYKEAAMMAGTKTLVALSGTGLGALTKRVFRSRTYRL
jgi:hypothetical protein